MNATRISTALANSKALAASGAAAGASGASTWFHWLPDDIAKLSVIISLATFSVIFFFKVKHSKREKELHQLDIALKKAQLEKLKNDDIQH